MKMKTYKNGLILGKFYPFHKGHEYLIQEAVQQCENLTVLVCSLQKETISGIIRFEWVKKTFPNINVVHVTDENPQYPEEHPNFWDIWKTTIQKAHPNPIDVIFTSEDYGYPLAKVLGCKHIEIDKERKKFPISGTKLRENPYKYWEFLPEVVRPCFVKKIVITGAESTGKTTLCQKLAKEFETIWVPEFARIYLEEKQKSVEKEDILRIAKGHTELEDEYTLKANRVLIIDTDMIITKLYSQIYFQTVPKFVLDEIQKRKYHLHIVLTPDVSWVADPLRDLPHFRDEFHKLLLEELQKVQAHYQIVSGNYQERFHKAKEIISKLLDF